MKRRERALACAVCWALSCLSCSSPATCNSGDYNANEPSRTNARGLTSNAQTDSLLLSEANQSIPLRFRATLSGLPELWPSYGGVQGGMLTLSFGSRYESEPLGGDGHTEMPQLVVTLSERAQKLDSTLQTRTYPGPGLDATSAVLFQDCALGARQCETTIDANFRRIEGAPFPPVRVSYRATAAVNTDFCTVFSSEQLFTLEVEEP